MKHIKISLTLLSFAVLAIQLSGCAALLLGGAAGAGSVVYVKGQLKEDMNASVPSVYAASISALKELNLPITEDKHDNLSAKVKSRFADGQDVWIDVEYLSVESSKLTIRVGVMGDERKSRQILDAVHRHLSRGTRKS